MDIRDQKTPSSSPQDSTQQSILTQQQLTDSLIFNIMKKIQTRERLMDEYAQQKQQTNRNPISKYFLHSTIPAYYAGTILFTKFAKIIYLKSGQPFNRVFTIPNLLFHICVFISLNEYFKYKNTFLVRRELGEEYRLYQRNVEHLMQQKLENFSLMNKVANADFMNQDKLMQIFKYRLVV